MLMPNTTRRYRQLALLFIFLMLAASACLAKALPAQIADESQAQLALSVTDIIPATSEGQTRPSATPILVTPAELIEIPSTETLIAPPLSTDIGYNYPESFYIRGIVGHVQVYELGCESSAAVDWAYFFGKTIYESNFQAEQPVSDNPDFGYVGDPDTDGWGQIPPYAYGVHSDPVADLLVAYGLPAQSKKGYTLEEVREKISQSKPVFVWIIGNMEYSVPVEYTDSQGRKSIVAPYEHVVILTGYDQNTVRYMSNGRFYDVPNEVFLTSWQVLGNMAVVHE